MPEPQQPLKLMDYKDIESLCQLDQPPENELWDALGMLVEHLDEHYLEVQRTQLCSKGRHRLQLFSARNKKQTPCFLAVSDGGMVTLGLVESMETQRTMQLRGFDPLWTELASVVISGHYRPLGNKLDAWILVRQHERLKNFEPQSIQAQDKPQEQVYHLLLSCDDKQELMLAHSRDDYHDEMELGAAISSQNFPVWLRQMNYHSSPLTSPFDEFPKNVQDKILALAEQSHRVCELVLRNSHHLVFSIASRLYYVNLNSVQNQEAEINSFEALDAIEDVSLFPHRVDNKVLAVLALENGLLQAVEIATIQHQYQELWQFACEDFPAALANVPLQWEKNAAKGTQKGIPDLLLLLQSGKLLHLRHKQPEDRYLLWKQLLLALRLPTFEQKCEMMNRPDWWTKRKELHHLALFSATVRQFLESLPHDQPETRTAMADQLSKLFKACEQFQVLNEALTLILEAYKQQDLSRTIYPCSAEQNAEALSYLLHEIYVNRETDLELEDQIDSFTRLRESDEVLCPFFKRLILRSKINRESYWSGEQAIENPTINQVLKASLGIERFCNTYWIIDHFNSNIHLHGPVVGLAFLSCRSVPEEQENSMAEVSDQTLLIAAHTRRLVLIQLTSESHRFDSIFKEVNIPEQQDTIERILSIGNQADTMLLTVHHSGRMYFYDVTLDAWTLVSVTGSSHPRALAYCPSSANSTILAIGSTSRLGSYLTLVDVTPHECKPLAEYRIPLPKIRSLDISRSTSTYRVVIGSDGNSPIICYRFDSNGGHINSDRFRDLNMGTHALSYDARTAPEYALISECDGFLWCARLENSDNKSVLNWIYKVPGATKCIEAVSIGSERYFLIGTERGLLKLIKANTGERAWQHQCQAGIVQIAVLNGQSDSQTVAVVTIAGTIIFFKLVIDDDSCRKITLSLCGALDKAQFFTRQDERPITRDIRLVWAIYQLENQENPLRNFKLLRQPAHRCRFVQTLARFHAKTIPYSFMQDFLNAMNAREIHLFVAYLNDEMKELDMKIWRVFCNHNTLADQTEHYNYAIAVSFFKRWSRQNRFLSMISREFFPRTLLKSPWVRSELARLLLVELRWQDHDPAILLDKALPYLFFFPPFMFHTMGTIFPNSEKISLFVSIGHLIDLLEKKAKNTDFFDLILKTLHPTESENISTEIGSLYFLSAFFSLTSNDFTSKWGNNRNKIIANLSCLQHFSKINRSYFMPVAAILKYLSSILGPNPIPESHKPFEQHQSWFTQLNTRLFGQEVQKKNLNQTQLSWDQFPDKVNALFNLRLRQISHSESDFLWSQIRPLLQNAKPPKHGDHDHIRVFLKLLPDGNKKLENVTIQIDSDLSLGLLSPGQVATTLTFPRFPAAWKEFPFELEGYLRPGQQQLILHTHIRSSSEPYERRDIWTLRIPVANVSTWISLPLVLPEATQICLQQLIASTGVVMFIGLDKRWGRNDFVQMMLDQHRAVELDLDLVLADYGQGRKFNQVPLNLALIREKIAAAKLTKPLPSSPLIISNLDQLLERMFRQETAGLLEQWLEDMRTLAMSKTESPYYLFVSSQHLNQLMRYQLASIEVFMLNAFIREKYIETKSCINELQTFCNSKIGSLDGSSYLFYLNWDFRLIFWWMHVLRSDYKKLHADPAHFYQLEEVGAFLRQEIISLSPFELLVLMLGAVSKSRIKVRQLHYLHIPCEFAIFGKSQDQVRLEANLPIPEIAYKALLKNYGYETLLVWGYQAASEEKFSETELAAWLQHNRQNFEQAITSLMRRGFTCKTDTRSYYTHSPYREIILRYYNDAPSGVQKDTWVFQQLCREKTFPIEILPIEDLFRLPEAQILQLLPQATDKDVNLLLALLGLYNKKPRAQDLTIFCRKIWKNGFFEEPRMFAISQFDNLEINIVAHISENEAVVFPDLFIVWLPAGSKTALFEVIVSRLEEAKKHWQEIKEEAPRTRLLFIGPGAEGKAYDDQRRYAVIRYTHWLQATWQGDIGISLLRIAQVQFNLKELSPFQTNGALSPGSKVFVGRSQELKYIQDQVRRTSILIIACRRMGKTSLLNQVRYWAQQQSDLLPIYIDLQGISNERGVKAALNLALDHQSHLESWRQYKDGGLLELAYQVKASGRLPLFLINEVDELLENNRYVVEQWRSLNDSALARFVFVGYSVLLQLQSPASPLFHFTSGTHANHKAIILSCLSMEEAYHLLDNFDQSDLQLQWRIEEEKIEAYQLLADRSYRIPWVLQQYCDEVVVAMEKQRTTLLTSTLIEQTVDQNKDLLWKYIRGINFYSLSRDKGNTLSKDGTLLILYILARAKYFMGTPPLIRDPQLLQLSPLHNSGFRLDEARELSLETLGQLIVSPGLPALRNWIQQIDMDQLFQMLTLTLILEPDPDNNSRYAFMMHILPRELYRKYYEQDPTLDNLIIETAIPFIHKLEHPYE